ncbi:60S acidic ribosomal protein P1-like [Protopterus annectens]|uniref:60S acidic ribosomal protein P1-like n=1 Tax=Protopterus annectens TaxID=7888 RepID=UPI001CF9EC3C|nr:60S acidic ribosomal protein P1-like [Protopterus annectens]
MKVVFHWEQNEIPVSQQKYNNLLQMVIPQPAAVRPVISALEDEFSGHVWMLEHLEEDKLNALIKTVNVSIERFWPSLLAKALANISIGSLISSVGAGGGAPVAGGVALTAGGGTAPAEEKKKEEEKKEESDENMAFGLFDQNASKL